MKPVMKPDGKNQKIMISKERVKARLIKSGNNINDVERMVSTHYEYAASKYETVKQIAECIRAIY